MVSPVRAAFTSGLVLALAGSATTQGLPYDATVLHAFNAGQVAHPECQVFRILDGEVYGTSTFGSSYAGFFWDPASGMRQTLRYRDINVHRVAVSHDLVIDTTTGTQTSIPGTASHPLATGYSINANSVVVGRLSEQTISRGYWSYTAMWWSPQTGTRTLLVPSARDLVHVNDNGLAVGHVYTAANRPQAFVVDLLTGAYTLFSSLLPPDPLFNSYSTSEVTYVSNAGHVVGQGFDGNTRRGFVWTQANGFEFLPALDGGDLMRVHPTSVDSTGRVVGHALNGNGDWRAFVYFPQVGIFDLNHLADVPDNVVIDRIERISDDGWICGSGIVGSWSPPKGVVLRIRQCQPSVGHDAGGTAFLQVCGQPLSAGNTADLHVQYAPAHSPGVLAVSGSIQPMALLGGTLATWPIVFTVPFVTDASGALRVPRAIPGGVGSATAYLQALIVDASGTLPPDFTNAVQVDLLP